MKKTSILLISLALVMLFASSAFAAQATFSVGSYTYATPTTVVSVTYGAYNRTTGLYDSKDLTGRVLGETKFTAEGIANYPYEIYLPNEERPDQYRIHTGYTKNTDACASCHATHTAVGPSLLQWYTTYDTCIACHDGTVTTTYNVINGRIAANDDAPTYGGMFGTGVELSLSNHNVTGAVTIASAPGGSVVGEDADKGYGVKYRTWESTFGCESCHTPHGQGGNARILSPDPNGFATLNNSHDDLGVNTTSGAIYNGSTNVPIITGYPYKPVIYVGSADQTASFVIMNNGTSGSVADGAYSYIAERAGSSYQLTDITNVKAVVPYQVRMEITNYLGLNGNSESVKHVSGINYFCGACHVDYNTEPDVTTTGNGIEQIMGNSAKRPGYGDLTGTFSSAHRHAVGLKWNYAGAADTGYIGWENKPMMTQGLGEDGNDVATATGSTTDNSYISCLTCHFAHGTSESFWQDWINKPDFLANSGYTSWDPSEMKEISGSSALKRLPNMGTCEACHQKGPDASGYAANTALGAVIPNDDVTEGIFALGGGSVSDASCATAAAACHQHEAKIAKYNNAVSGSAMNTVKSGSAVTCETCHGQAGNHVRVPSAKNITNPRNLSVSDQNANCTTAKGCHDGAPGTAVTKWNGFKHESTSVISCNTCHDSHQMNTEASPIKGERNALCSSCHADFNTLDLNGYHN